MEKVVYESRPRLHIPANLYIPTGGKPPYPGVLFQMGHSLNGKAAESYQRCCQGLARLGYLVLAFDPMGQGERVYYPDAQLKRTRLSSSDDEHTLPGKQMLLYGDTSTRFQVWDAMRSLDYLAAHPLVDPKRLASTGQSGGGTLTMLLMAVDDRLAAAAVASGNTENLVCADFNPPGSTDDAEQNFLDGGPAGFDRWDLFYPVRSQAPADRRQRQGLLRHLLPQLHLQRLGRVPEAAPRLRSAGPRRAPGVGAIRRCRTAFPTIRG